MEEDGKVGEVERVGELAVSTRRGGWLNENNLQIVSNPSTVVDDFSLKRGLGWGWLK